MKKSLVLKMAVVAVAVATVAVSQHIHLDEYIDGTTSDKATQKCRSVEQARQSWESLKDGGYLVEFFE